MDGKITEVARSIRPYLDDLAGPDARQVDHRIAELLSLGRAGEQVDDAIVDLLNKSGRTRDWAASVLADPLLRPPELQGVIEKSADRGPVFTGLANANGGGIVGAQHYSCPIDGDFVWWRSGVGRPVPHCPDHPAALLIAD